MELIHPIILISCVTQLQWGSSPSVGTKIIFLAAKPRQVGTFPLSTSSVEHIGREDKGPARQCFVPSPRWHFMFLQILSQPSCSQTIIPRQSPKTKF